MATKFTPTQKIGKDKEGNNYNIDLYKGTTFDEVADFLEENGTAKDKAEFKKNCFLAYKKEPTGKKDKKGKDILDIVKDENGDPVFVKTEKMNWLYAKQEFFKKFAPEHLPKAKEPKAPKSSRIANW